MNKLVFHEGGQPIYLNDFQTLQEQFTDIMGAFIDLMTYSQLNRTSYEVDECNFYQRAHIGRGPNNEAQQKNGFFVNLKLDYYIDNYSPVPNAQSPGIFQASLFPGYVYINGEFLKYERTVLTLTDSNPEFFVIVKTQDEDLRTLDNGEQAYCVRKKYAVLSTERPETGEYYSSHTIMSFVENFYYKMFWREKRVDYTNGIITG